MSKENPNLDLNKGFSKLSDVLKSKDRTFQHLKNIEAFAVKELEFAKETKGVDAKNIRKSPY